MVVCFVTVLFFDLFSWFVFVVRSSVAFLVCFVVPVVFGCFSGSLMVLVELLHCCIPMVVLLGCWWVVWRSYKPPIGLLTFGDERGQWWCCDGSDLGVVVAAATHLRCR
ncbi:hypothetical protein QL285_025589 [Trifolium repens]|nr:hypothetical protein QL285_025589 [Trifolium repens]